MSLKHRGQNDNWPLEADDYLLLIENLLGSIIYVFRALFWITETLLGSCAMALLWGSFGQPELASHALVWLVAAIAVHGVRACGSGDDGPLTN